MLREELRVLRDEQGKLRSIIDIVLRTLGVSEEEFRSRGRMYMCVNAREMVAYLARRHTALSYPEIARGIGRSGHGMVIGAEQRMMVEIQSENGKVVDIGGEVYTMHELAEKIERELADVLMSPTAGV